MNLFEIDRAISDCIDEETGEIIDLELLNSLSIERESKIENVILFIKNLNAENSAITAEIDSFKKRIKQNISKVERLERWLAYATSGEKFSTSKCSLIWRKSEKVDISEDAVVPEKYCVTKTLTTSIPDKKALKVFLKNGGTVNGVQIIETINAQIK